MTDTMTLTWGGYKARFTISNPYRKDYESPEYRYTITDPEGREHDGRLKGSGICYAVGYAVEDILAREERLAQETRFLALEANTEEAIANPF